MTADAIIYPRIIIKGSLTTQAPLHIGTGLENSDGENSYNELCLDAQQKPYIPASSLRGYLRNIIRQHAPENLDIIFGMARQKSTATHAGNSGLLRVYDATWQSGDYPKQFISRTSIDPVTATAKYHHLATHAIVPAQSVFLVQLELDKANLSHLQAMLQALASFSTENTGKLGQGKSIGQGALLWQQAELSLLTEKQLKKWLTSKKTYKKAKTEKTLARYYVDGSKLPELRTRLSHIDAYTNTLQSITIKLHADSPILINDPHVVQEQANQQAKHPLDLIHKVENGEAIIPGSTLKGWARARCRRILLTLLMADTVDPELANAEKISETLSNKLFGETDRQGCLYFDDALVNIDQQHDLHKQTFNAIDRFTGGVKAGALYKVAAIWPENDFSTQIHYHTHKLPDWAKLLLLYVLKDSMQGDLVLGWGKSKGYGRLQLSLADYPDWSSLIQTVDTETLEQWDAALQQAIIK